MPMLPDFTELDAVNDMLVSIGQTPVNTLAGVSGIRDVNIAKAELMKVSRNVQLIGWNFNTDDTYDLAPDINGQVAIPAGVLRIDPVDASADYVPRRAPNGPMALWDKANRTFTFTAPVSCKVVWGYAFEDLPPAASAYVALAAARKFQKRIIGSNELDGFNAEDEQRAWATLMRDERASRDTNMFRKSASLQSFGSRSY